MTALTHVVILACLLVSANAEDTETVSLMQTRADISYAVNKTDIHNDDGVFAFGSSGCAVLTNQGASFTVATKVGTDLQDLDLIVDTGSDEFLVSSCNCKTCSGKCYKHNIPESAKVVELSYGSGDVTAAVMSAPVLVGGVAVDMDDSMLAMLKNNFDFTGPMEGIFALGAPHKGDGSLVRRQTAVSGSGSGSAAADDYFYTKSFLENAGISTFSLCFSKSSNGVLRLGDKKAGGDLGSIGEMHWGLGLSGVSVGSASGDVVGCSSGGGYDTPCGAIPDSGTTLITGPSKQIEALYEGICKSWPSCKAAAAFNSKDGNAGGHLDEVLSEKTIDEGTIDEVVGTLLGKGPWEMKISEQVETCKNLDSLPSVFFQVTGSGGSSKTIEIPGSNYIFKDSGLCMPGFEALEYETLANGPVWILGMPLFMSYVVGYDVGSSPASMSFDSGSCKSCGGSLLRGTTTNADEARWEVTGPRRKPKLDVSQPL